MRTFLLAFVPLITVVNPLAAVPQFIVLTEGPLHRNRFRVALVSGMATIAVLAVFLVAGEYVFRFFGITIPAFRVMGGTLFFLNALKSLMEDERHIRTLDRPSRGTATESSPIEDPSADPVSVAIVPLATPLLAGPGAITSVMVLVNLFPGFQNRVAVLVAIIAVGVLSSLTLMAAVPLSRFIGERFRLVFQKIMALLLGAIGVQLVLNGVVELVRSA